MKITICNNSNDYMLKPISPNNENGTTIATLKSILEHKTERKKTKAHEAHITLLDHNCMH